MTRYYKVLKSDGSAVYGTGKWFLPKGKKPGKWMPPIKGELEMCKKGYHAVDREHLVEWVNARIFVLEFKDEPVTDGLSKYVGAQARLLSELKTWNERTARLFACD